MSAAAAAAAGRPRWVDAAFGVAKRHSFLVQLGFVTAKTSAADIFVQVAVEGRDLSSIDWRRNAVFTLFGFTYLGIVQWALYVPLYSRIFGAATLERIGAMTLRKKLSCRTALRTLGGQILLDNFIIGPFIYFPIFYAFKEALQGEPSFSGLVQRSLQNYRHNFFQDKAIQQNKT